MNDHPTEPGLSRDQHTFLFADLAGFTALTEAHGDEQAADLATAFLLRMRAMAPRFESEVIKSIGDAVMVRSDRASSAIDLALNTLDEEDARDEFPGVRIGIHSGPAVERDGDWFGASVNVAARVSAAAAGGEIVLTEATIALAGVLEDVEAQPLGLRVFKNVADPIQLFRVVRRGMHRGETNIDPVCRMTVGEGRGIGCLAYGGRTYHFCSMACAKRFTGSPELYAVS